MVLAAEAHDNGWWHWDVNPSVDEEGVPLAFTRTPREKRSGFYGKGIDYVVEKDLYAGLMVSMHGVGLPQQRYGTMPSMSKRVDEYSLKFIEEREPSHKLMMNQIAALEQYAGASGPDQIQFNYRMMQVFDRLSLFFCANFDITAVLASGSHSEGKAYYGPSIKPTPVQLGEDDTELTLRVVDPSAVIAEPYPFDVSPLRVGVRGRLIPRITYRSQEEFRETYVKAPRQTFEFTLTAS
jgi:hypothetical protein